MASNGIKMGVLVTAAGALCMSAGNVNALTALEFHDLITSAGADEIEIKLQNFDEGTQYPSMPAGTVVGGLGDVAGAIGGAAALDGIAGQIGPASGDPGEDGWGILRVTQIFGDHDGFTNPIWETADGGEVTVMFWGLVDGYIRYQGGAASGQDRIEASGLRTAWYFDETADWDPTTGPGARTGTSSYPTVTDGSPLFTASSTGGHINPAGVEGGSNSEFRSDFDFATLSGRGTTFLSIDPGSGLLASELDSDAFAPIAGNVGYANADLKVTFTTQPDNNNGWLVRSNDPINGRLVPLPAAAWAALPMLAGLGIIRKARRNG